MSNILFSILLLPILANPSPPSPEVLLKIEQFNQNVDKIVTISATTNCVGIQNGRSVESRGLLLYQKNEPHSNFRMVNNGTILANRKVLDVGSNPIEFWFWSQRLKPPTLLWCRYADMARARELTTLNPLFLENILSVKKINTTNILQAAKPGKDLILQSQEKLLNGEDVFKLTTLDGQFRITGYYYYNQSKQLLSKAVIHNWYRYENVNIPRNINMEWFTEGIQVQLQLSNFSVNKRIGEQNFRKPAISPSRNLAQ